MNFPWENVDKALELASVLDALENQIYEVRCQVYQFPRKTDGNTDW